MYGEIVYDRPTAQNNTTVSTIIEKKVLLEEYTKFEKEITKGVHNTGKVRFLTDGQTDMPKIVCFNSSMQGHNYGVYTNTT